MILEDVLLIMGSVYYAACALFLGSFMVYAEKELRIEENADGGKHQTLRRIPTFLFLLAVSPVVMLYFGITYLKDM